MHIASECGNWGRTKRNALQTIDCRRSSGRHSSVCCECHRCVVHLLPGHGKFLASPSSPPKCAVCTITHSTSEDRNDVGGSILCEASH